MIEVKELAEKLAAIKFRCKPHPPQIEFWQLDEEDAEIISRVVEKHFEERDKGVQTKTVKVAGHGGFSWPWQKEPK